MALHTCTSMPMHISTSMPTHTARHICPHTPLYTYAYTHLYAHFYTHRCTHMPTHTSIHILLHTPLYAYAYTHLYTSACTYLYTYACTHIYTSTSQGKATSEQERLCRAADGLSKLLSLHEESQGYYGSWRKGGPQPTCLGICAYRCTGVRSDMHTDIPVHRHVHRQACMHVPYRHASMYA